MFSIVKPLLFCQCSVDVNGRVRYSFPLSFTSLQVEEGTRKSLFKLRSTWEEIFPLKKLFALDVRVNSVDPAWPIKQLPPNVNASIHVNPKFLKPVSISL